MTEPVSFGCDACYAADAQAAIDEAHAALVERISRVTGVGERAVAYAVAALRECREECALDLGSTRALQYTAIGDAMNVASRLVNIASPGEVIVSESTMRYVAGRVEATALPPVKVKGKAEELRVFRVSGLKQTPRLPNPSDWTGPTNA